MTISFYVVDAFTDKPFAGNPAAVCLLDVPLDEELMKSIAAEMNLSETAFIYPIEKENHLYSLRWFTPDVEVNLCGHATLASAFAMLTQTELSKAIPVVLRFSTKSGELQVESSIKDDQLLLQMNFPLGNPQPVELSSELKADILKLLGNEGAPLPIDSQYCEKTRKLVLQFENLSTILNLKPSASLTQLQFTAIDVRGIICTTDQYGGNEKFNGYDFVSRYFAPWVGINEDPVTGSAHTVLAPFWQQKQQKPIDQEFKAFQASSRGGEVRIQILEESKRVLLKGVACLVSKGTLFV